MAWVTVVTLTLAPPSKILALRIEPSFLNIMPKRKYNENSSVRRKKLYVRVREGNLAMHPCDKCIRQGKECRLTDDSPKCAEYVSAAVSCSLYVSDADWDRIDREQAALERQLENLHAEQLKLWKKLSSVKRRKKEMFARELANVDELELDERELDERDLDERIGQEGHFITFDFELFSELPADSSHPSAEIPGVPPARASDC